MSLQNFQVRKATLECYDPDTEQTFTLVVDDVAQDEGRGELIVIDRTGHSSTGHIGEVAVYSSYYATLSVRVTKREGDLFTVTQQEKGLAVEPYIVPEAEAPTVARSGEL